MSKLWIVVAVSGIILSAPCSANESNSAASSDIHQSACMKCHKRNGTMQGIHGNGQSGITCVDCHGERQGHPRKASELVVFNSPESNATSQVKPCVSCHLPATLGEQEWTHNVHSNKVSCSQCHRLHTAEDPMMALASNDKAALCQQCHQSKQD